jgi:hypothetical protein
MANVDRRRLAELRRSLQNPHPESADLVERELKEWTLGLTIEDTEALVDSSLGKPVHWVRGEGWVEGRERDSAWLSWWNSVNPHCSELVPDELP